ncbi:hypothetical protein TSUD_338500 [Trifolium subterraneum]|nr:hypothetical protein TSUD_338500 [Trifolium subterraneum]
MFGESSASSVHGGNGGWFTTNANKGYQNDTLNPYFMHPNENPALVLVTPLLNGPNYHSWSRSMTVAIRSKSKLHFLNGSLPRPVDDDRDFLAWDRCNTMVMSWITNSLDPEIAQSVLWMDVAADIWKELKDRFYQGDIFRISDIHDEICTLKQGLNEQYSHVKSQIMLMDPLPPLSKVYSLLVQQERQYVTPLDESKLLAMSNTQYSSRGASSSRGRGGYSRGGGRSSSGRGKSSNSKVCTYCGMTNHVIDNCFKKYGYPPHWQQNGNGPHWQPNGNGPHGQKNGNGPGNGNRSAVINNVANGHDEDNQSEANEFHHHEQEVGPLMFTPEQHQALLALIQGSSSMQSHSVNHITLKSHLNTGFKPGVKGHILFDIHSKELFLSRDVIFFEHLCPYHINISSNPTPVTNTHIPDSAYLDDIFHYESSPSQPSPTPTTHHNPTSSTNPVVPNTLSDKSSSPATLNDKSSTPPPPSIPIRRSTRPTNPLFIFKTTIVTSLHLQFMIHIHLLTFLHLQALKNENWTSAIKSELSALINTNTWSLVPLPAHKKAIGCKWVFKLKLHADGPVERYKARLVAKGFTQTEGLDYLDTFSPVVKMTTVRMLLAVAASQKWPLYQLDVNTTFLHGDLNEEVYMQPPPGLELPHPNLVCKLQRSLYGLKQASRQWNTKLTDTLISSGYTQSMSDYSLFTKKSATGFTVILVYVDDLVLGGTDMEEINTVKTLLNNKFSIKDQGVLKYFLGFEVARTAISNTNAASSTTSQNLWNLSDPTTYRRLIGRLLYLTHSRPEISYAVSKLSQFLSEPTNEHMLAGLHVLKYLKNNPGKGLFFSSESSLQIKEAEYRALAHATCEAQWLLYLLQDLHISHDFPIALYCDNQSALHIAANPVFHERTKHIEIDYHVVRDKVQQGILHLLPVSSKDQLADILTKSLHPGPFTSLESKLGLLDIHSSLMGGVKPNDKAVT